MKALLLVVSLALIAYIQISVAKKLKFKPSTNDDSATVNADFESYKAELELKFSSNAEMEKAKAAFIEARKLVKSKPGKMALNEYSHIPFEQLRKMRTGYTPPATEPIRMTGPIKFNPRQHRGALKKASKGLKAHRHVPKRKRVGKSKRQTDSDWDKLLDVFYDFGYDTSKFEFVNESNLDSSFASDNFTEVPITTAPESLDWRDYGYVTPVKNQGNCGCCYAFSSVGAIESARAACFGLNEPLSEQEVVSCATTKGFFPTGADGTVHGGCDGGHSNGVFQYNMANGGFSLESNYPFNQQTNGTTSSCVDQLPQNAPNSQIESFQVLPGNETLMKFALVNGPYPVAIEASPSFLSWADDFFDGNCGKNVDHAVLLIGYGVDPTYGDYWLVKNSWGVNWGTNGFMKMARNKNGTCGIDSAPVSLTLVGCSSKPTTSG